MTNYKGKHDKYYLPFFNNLYCMHCVYNVVVVLVVVEINFDSIQMNSERSTLSLKLTLYHKSAYFREGCAMPVSNGCLLHVRCDSVAVSYPMYRVCVMLNITCHKK